MQEDKENTSSQKTTTTNLTSSTTRKVQAALPNAPLPKTPGSINNKSGSGSSAAESVDEDVEVVGGGRPELVRSAQETNTKSNKYKSWVWEFFSAPWKDDLGHDWVTCLLIHPKTGVRPSISWSGCTTNLQRHLDRYHEEVSVSRAVAQAQNNKNKAAPEVVSHPKAKVQYLVVCVPGWLYY